MVERLVIMTPGDVIAPEDLPPPLRPREAVAVPADAGAAQSPSRRRATPSSAPTSWASCGPTSGTSPAPPSALGIERGHLYRKLKAYGIAAPRKGEEPTRPDA